MVAPLTWHGDCQTLHGRISESTAVMMWPNDLPSLYVAPP